MPESVLLQIAVAAGWDPFNPSAECRAIMSRPDIREQQPGTLQAIDVIGIHWYVATLELVRRFGAEPGLDAWGKDEEAFAHLAALFVLSSSDVVVEGGLTPERASSLNAWFSERLVPAAQRMRRAKDLEEILSEPGRYEPAFAAALAVEGRNLSNVAADCANAALGVRMHYEGTRNPSGGRPMDLAHLEEVFAFVVDERDRRLIEVRNGKLVLDPKRMKSALDGVAGRVPTLRSDDSAVDEEGDAGTSPDPQDLLERSMDAEAVASAVRDDLEQVRPGSARALVLSNFLATLNGQERSLRQIAREEGVDEGDLSRAKQAALATIRRACGESA